MQDQRGFSLLELMTVVAIIAALTMVAVPSYQSFQARARQKEGLQLLTSFYSAAVASHTEFRKFPGNFVGTGFAPVGLLNYRLRSNNNPPIAAGLNAFTNDAGCYRTLEACNCGGNCNSFKTWDEMPVGVVGSSIGVATVAAVGPCPTLGALATTNNTFVVGVAGVISTKAALVDGYYMNEKKEIEMCQDGLQ